MQPRSPFVAVSCLALMVATATAQKWAEVVEPSIKAPRGKLLEWKSAQGKTYWYRLPEKLDSKSPPDLLLMFHGTGLNHEWSFANYPIMADFRRRDIVVSPDGVTPGQGTTFNFVQGPKDGEQVEGLINDFRKRFPVGRVYLYGHSQGAFFSYWFASEHPELVDGIVAHAGNLLDVKHSKLAKQKVAIGILHGRADAVVPVECATRTEKIYREQGYEKVKLMIVDGLSEQSGHWPLPMQLAQMLDWLDQVSTQSAAQSLRIIASELARKNVDLGVVVEQVGKARKLLPKADEADKKVLPAQLDALSAFLDKAAAAHAGKLGQEPALVDAKAPFGPWAAHFLLADRAFGDLPAWRKAMGKPRELAAQADKQVEKALKGLEKPAKDSIAAALKACEEAFRSPRVGELRVQIAAVVGAADGLAKLASTFAEREKAATEAVKAMAETSAPLLDELKTAAPALFEGK